MILLPVHEQMSEKDFQAAVVKLAKEFEWMVYHTYDSRKSTPGFPDLLMLKGKRMLVIELKTEKGKTTKAQDEWLDAFGKVETRHVDVWQPSDNSRIVKMLTGRME